MSTHTPGPWRLILADNLIEAKSGGRLVDLCIPRSLCISQEERDANARLIAAAPEMLAKLQAAAGWFDEMAKDFSAIASAKGDIDMRRVQTLAGLSAVNAERQANIIRDQIAKATGGAKCAAAIAKVEGQTP